MISSFLGDGFAPEIVEKEHEPIIRKTVFKALNDRSDRHELKLALDSVPREERIKGQIIAFDKLEHRINEPENIRVQFGYWGQKFEGGPLVPIQFSDVDQKRCEEIHDHINYGGLSQKMINLIERLDRETYNGMGDTVSPQVKRKSRKVSGRYYSRRT